MYEGGSPVPFEASLSVPAGFQQSFATVEASLRETAIESNFQGEVNGFRLYTFRHAQADPAIEKSWCQAVDFPVTDYMAFSYMPMATIAQGPQFAVQCSDNSMPLVMQQFSLGTGQADIVYLTGERAFGYDGSAARIVAASVGEAPAVVIAPAIESDSGRTWLAFATDAGFVMIDSQRVPLEELVKIAEGIECSRC
jgi:hypothetical protein